MSIDGEKDQRHWTFIYALVKFLFLPFNGHLRLFIISSFDFVVGSGFG